MKVLAVIDSIAFGGAETTLAEMAAAAPRHGIELEVAVVAPRSEATAEFEERLTAHGIQPHYLGIRRVKDPRGVWKVRRLVRRLQPDVVHAHLATAITFAVPAARLAHVPSLATLHHVPDEGISARDRWRERLAVSMGRHADFFVFVSQAARTECERLHGRVRNAVVLHNGIDIHRFRPDGPVASYEGATTDRDVLLIGHLRPGKGHAAAIAAWHRVLEHCPQARLVIVGSGPLEPHLRHAAAPLGDRVLFLGRRDDVPDVIRSADLVVLPSESEALPTVLIEAAASGCPVVATDVGGVREVVVDGVTGVLCGPTSKEFAAAVCGLLTDDAHRAPMARAARDHAVRRFSTDRWLGDLLRLYRSAIGRTNNAWRSNATRSKRAPQAGDAPETCSDTTDSTTKGASASFTPRSSRWPRKNIASSRSTRE